MCIWNLFKREPFDPSLIDLGEYELQLWEAQEKGGIRRPVPSIPFRYDREWTEKEMHAMKINRIQAERLYKTYRKNK